MMDYIVLTDWIINFDNSKAFEDPKLISYGDMDFDIKKNW